MHWDRSPPLKKALTKSTFAKCPLQKKPSIIEKGFLNSLIFALLYYTTIVRDGRLLILTIYSKNKM